MPKNKTRKTLLTAPQVAKILQVDLSTVHNWVISGALVAFRTPGNHLRFRREPVIELALSIGFDESEINIEGGE